MAVGQKKINMEKRKKECTVVKKQKHQSTVQSH